MMTFDLMCSCLLFIIMILLLIILTSCVCAATLVVNVSQTSYQAEENHNITLDWTFSPKHETLFILCELFTKVKPMVLYHVYEGDEVPEDQNKQFRGRVQCDKDALREGRITLHMSRLRTEDSGWYECAVITNDGWDKGECYLNVTAATDPPGPEPEPGPDPVSRGRMGLYCGLGLAAAAAAAAGSVLFRSQQLDQRNRFELKHNSNNLDTAGPADLQDPETSTEVLINKNQDSSPSCDINIC